MQAALLIESDLTRAPTKTSTDVLDSTILKHAVGQDAAEFLYQQKENRSVFELSQHDDFDDNLPDEVLCVHTNDAQSNFPTQLPKSSCAGYSSSVVESPLLRIPNRCQSNTAVCQSFSLRSVLCDSPSESSLPQSNLAAGDPLMSSSSHG